MTDENMAVKALLGKVSDADFLRKALASILQLLMEEDVSGRIGAQRSERTDERITYRNGYRDRSLQTCLGQLEIQIPKLRHGSYFPPFLEHRRMSDKALVSVIQQSWISGVSTRKVEDIVKHMGLDGISKSQVSQLCKDIDIRVNDFLFRPLEGEWPYLWLDATYLKVREGGRVISVAAIIAMAVNKEGQREIVGLKVGASEAEPFWTEFLRQLVGRGLAGVQLVISDAHEGLKAAINKVFKTTWQRCRVHWMRNALSYAPKQQQNMISAVLRQIFSQGDETSARAALREAAKRFGEKLPRLEAFLLKSEADVLAYMTFPASHHPRISNTNPLERLNKEVKRRSNVVGIFPCESSILRLIGAILLEQNDEWQLQRRYMPKDGMEELFKADLLQQNSQIEANTTH